MTIRMDMSCKSAMLCGLTLPLHPGNCSWPLQGQYFQFTDPSLSLTATLWSPVQTSLSISRPIRTILSAELINRVQVQTYFATCSPPITLTFPGALLRIPGCLIPLAKQEWCCHLRWSPETLLRQSVDHNCSEVLFRKQ